MNKVKVTVIGYGHLGKWHAEKAFNHELSQLVAIVESYEPNQKAAKEKYPDVLIVSSIEDVVDQVDAAVIVTPTSTHFELVKFLLQQGKHVFCEKPLCSKSEEATELRTLLKEGQVLQVGHSERCHEIWEKKRELFDLIESPWILKINRFAPFKGRATDVDVVQDLMIHDIDLMLHVMQQKPKSICAHGLKIRTTNYDHAVAEFNFSDGSKAFITSGRNSTHEVRELEVLHSSGAIRADLFSNTFQVATNTEFADGSFVQEENYNKRDHLLIEQDYFYKSILNGDKVFVNIDDGAVAVDYIAKVLESIDSNKTLSL